MRRNISAVRQHVAALRAALLSSSPGPIEQCLPRLVEAAGCLGSIERELRERQSRMDRTVQSDTANVDAESVYELNALKGDLRAVHKLIEQGAKFYQGWANLLGAATSGYTPAGEAAPLSAAGTLSIRG
jgi:hypothetical protein